MAVENRSVESQEEPVAKLRGAVDTLIAKLEPVGWESIPIGAVAGRVLAKNLLADRDSPALDVSAMDGYAISLDRLGALEEEQPQCLVQEVAPAGKAPATLEQDQAIRIFTGAPVPRGADCVVKREDTEETGDKVRLKLSVATLEQGMHIRRQGENIREGQVVMQAGTLLGPSQVAALASFGDKNTDVHRRVKVSVLNTGDELARAGEPVEPWTIRDSNGPTLAAWLAQLDWVDFVDSRQVEDTLEQTEAAIAACLKDSDAIVLTGGVSMGDADYVPAAIKNLGGEIVFHRLPIRPGRPVLGAIIEFEGVKKLVLGLPGNPVSVAVTSRVIGEPILRKLGGFASPTLAKLSVSLGNTEDSAKSIPLVWYRLVSKLDDGRVGFVPTRGSGDLVSLAASDGFVEWVPGSQCGGVFPFYSW